jgi:hypothetical protein
MRCSRIRLPSPRRDSAGARGVSVIYNASSRTMRCATQDGRTFPDEELADIRVDRTLPDEEIIMLTTGRGGLPYVIVLTDVDI